MRQVQNVLRTRSICPSPYAEREPATSRAVSARLTACTVHQARACQRRLAAKSRTRSAARPHVFDSTADTHNVRQFVTGHCPDEMTPDRIGQGSFLFLGFNHWVTSLSAGSAGLLILVGIPSAVFMFLSLRTRLAFM